VTWRVIRSGQVRMKHDAADGWRNCRLRSVLNVTKNTKFPCRDSNQASRSTGKTSVRCFNVQTTYSARVVVRVETFCADNPSQSSSVTVPTGHFLRTQHSAFKNNCLLKSFMFQRPRIRWKLILKRKLSQDAMMCS
jgi:hypothetical protein